MKQTGMLRGVNFGFWSRLGCSGQSASILCHQGLFLGSQFAKATPRLVSFRGHKKLKPRPGCFL